MAGMARSNKQRSMNLANSAVPSAGNRDAGSRAMSNEQMNQ